MTNADYSNSKLQKPLVLLDSTTSKFLLMSIKDETIHAMQLKQK